MTSPTGTPTANGAGAPTRRRITFWSGFKKLVGESRRSNGRSGRTGSCIVYFQSAKNTDSAGNKGYDAGKKVSGIKRHVAVDTRGRPIPFT